MSKYLGIALFPLIFLLSACPSTEVRDGVIHYVAPQEAKEEMWRSTACCSSLADIKYTELNAASKLRLKINSTLPTYNFSTGTSYILAYKLPVSASPMKLTIKSFFSGYAFYPAVMLLNTEFKATHNYINAIFEFVPTRLNQKAYLEGSIIVNPHDSPNYILIYTTDKLMRLTNEETIENRNYVHHYGPVGAIAIEFVRI